MPLSSFLKIVFMYLLYPLQVRQFNYEAQLLFPTVWRFFFLLSLDSSKSMLLTLPASASEIVFLASQELAKDHL